MPNLLTYTAEELRKLLRRAIYSAASLAVILKVHPRTLSRRSHYLFGLSTQAWADQERLVAAPAALIQLRSVKEAAYALGLKHPQQLSVTFKKCYGCSPTQFLARQDREALIPLPLSPENIG